MLFNVTIADANNALAAGQADQITAQAKAAAARWTDVLAPSSATLDIRITITTDYPRAAARSVANVPVPGQDMIYLPGAAYEAATEIDPNGSDADIEIFVHPEYLTQVWMNPLDGSKAPVNKRDFLATLTHELGHAFGFGGWTDWNTYATPSTFSGFDRYVRVIDGEPYFVGPTAMEVFGGPVPLTPGSLFHVGSPRVGSDLTHDLMNGIVATLGPDNGISDLALAILSDTGAATVLSDKIRGTAANERFNAGEGDDLIFGGGGSDHIEGGGGFDVVVFAGEKANYTIEAANGGWSVRQNLNGEVALLTNVEAIRFENGFSLLAAGAPAASSKAIANVLRLDAFDSRSKTALAKVLDDLTIKHHSAAERVAIVVDAAKITTTVATLSYQFFTGQVPGDAGLSYLVSPTGPNANNLNSDYFATFNLENRYINFAVNLGRDGAGRDSFSAEYESISLQQATARAYGVIFGATPDSAKVDALLSGRVDYFYALGQTDLGAKAAMVGWLLSEAVKAGAGQYARANDAYLTKIAASATPADFAIDLIAVYGRPEYDLLP